MRALAVGAGLALVGVIGLVAWAADLVDSVAPALVFGAAAIVVSAATFLGGPRIRDRTYLLGPAALGVTPAAVGLGSLVSRPLGFAFSALAGIIATAIFARGLRRRA